MSYAVDEPESAFDPFASAGYENEPDIGEQPLLRYPGEVRARKRKVAARAPRTRAVTARISVKPARKPQSGSRALRWASNCFLIIGLLTASYCAWYYGQGTVFQVYQNWRFEQIAAHRPTSISAFVESYFARIPFIGSKLESASTSSPSGPNAPQPTAPRAILAEGALIGRLQVPRLGLSTIVLQGDSDEVLRKAVGHIPSTSLPGTPGNFAVAGHRDTFFRALKDIRKDDEIVLATSSGTYHYSVRSVEIVTPKDTRVIAPTEQASLTMVTCFPFYYVGSAPKRYIVHADQVGEVNPAGEVDPATAAALISPSTAAYAADSSSARDGEASSANFHGHTNPRRGRPGASRRVTGRARARHLAQNEAASDASSDAVNSSSRSNGPGHRVISWFKSLTHRTPGS